MVRSLSILFCLLGANVVLGADNTSAAEDAVEAIIELEDPQSIECNSSEVCPKYAIADYAEDNGLVKFAVDAGLLEVSEEPNSSAVFGCCLDNMGPAGSRCGSFEECGKMLPLTGPFEGMPIKTFATVAICVPIALCLCCCCIIACCCCGGKKKKSGRQQLSDTGSESDNECPFGNRNARLFLDALMNEYVAGENGAVGEFFDNNSIPRNDQQAMDEIEDRVRNSGNPRQAINRLRQKWGL